MIPDWQAALSVAYLMLKPGGHLAVCDFTVTRQHSLFTRKFWPFVFKHDHVYLREAHLDRLRGNFEEVKVHVGAGGFPYVPGLVKCPWYFGIFRKPIAPTVADAFDSDSTDGGRNGAPTARKPLVAKA
jgi:S-adenosylmethionine-diacylgycerolhomoserine-N-methlytransferase